MREPISLKEIIAVVVKRGRGIVCTAIALAVLLGAYRFMGKYDFYQSPENTAEAVERANEEAKQTYKDTYERLQKDLAYARRELDRMNSYMENSILMQQDSYKVVMDTTVLAITDIEEVYRGAVGQTDIDPDYFANKIQDFYVLYWESLVLTESLSGHNYTNISEQYLRELVTLTETDSGTLTIVVRADTMENAVKLADAVNRCFQEMHAIVESNTYGHTLSVVARTGKVMVDDELGRRQIEMERSIANNKKSIDEIEEDLKQLKEPVVLAPYSMKDVLVDTAIFVILGAVGGAGIACVWVLVMFLMKNRVESSRQMEQMVGVPFLGSVAKKGSVWCRLAQKLLGERVWEDADMAAGFIAESVKSVADVPQQLAVLTTLSGEDAAEALEKVTQAVSFCGKVSCVDNAEKNPETIALLRSCKTAVLAERISVSEMTEVLSLLELANRMGVKVVGFVTI